MTSLTDRLTAKRTVLVLVLVAASVVLVSGSREWVSGSADDVVLGAGALHARGSDVAPGALAAALVGMAAAVAAATTGTVARVVAACSMLLAAVLGATAVISVLVDPGGALGRLAAAGTGRNGNVTAHGHIGGWAWAALAAMLVMGFGGLSALVGGRHWRGLSSRYEAGVPEAGSASAWDRLSRGEDPTARG
ncbi:MAG: Trp biosynthesis-associated membrane protein [Actinomycetota bacterium]